VSSNLTSTSSSGKSGTLFPQTGLSGNPVITTATSSSCTNLQSFLASNTAGSSVRPPGSGVRINSPPASAGAVLPHRRTAEGSSTDATGQSGVGMKAEAGDDSAGSGLTANSAVSLLMNLRLRGSSPPASRFVGSTGVSSSSGTAVDSARRTAADVLTRARYGSLNEPRQVHGSSSGAAVAATVSGGGSAAVTRGHGSGNSGASPPSEMAGNHEARPPGKEGTSGISCATAVANETGGGGQLSSRGAQHEGVFSPPKKLSGTFRLFGKKSKQT
ncbi:unnamed protein product, partial [Protopolystoma xenopodis]